MNDVRSMIDVTCLSLYKPLLDIPLKLLNEFVVFNSTFKVHQSIFPSFGHCLLVVHIKVADIN